MLKWVIAIVVALIVIYTILYWLGRRRGTPDYSWRDEDVPPVGELMQTLSGLTQSTIHRGNAVEILVNDAIFAPMLEDIAAAKHSVHVETFVWWGGRVERRFADALIEASKRGVDVRLIADGVGAMRRSSGIFDEMREAGVEIHIFSPLSLFNVHRFNERTHRKLVIVDGRIGYTMGHGIADEWLEGSEEHFRDTGVRLTGPVVHGLQAVFTENWISGTCQLLFGPGVFPDLEPTGDIPMVVVSSTAGEDYSKVELAFTTAIAAARHEVLIQNPYFAPDRNVVDLLCATARRGVDVTIMVPGSKIDNALLRHAARHLYPTLIKAGIKVLEYKPELSHQKVMIVDRILSRVGSTNLDCRSLELNDEAGVLMLDAGVAAELRAQFVCDAKACHEITLEYCDRRRLPVRLWDAGAYLIHGQL